MSKASLFFLFNHKGSLYIVDNNHVQDVPKPRELIRRFSTIEQIRKFILIDEEFSIENGMLTPSMKVRRFKVKEKFKNKLEKLYL